MKTEEVNLKESLERLVDNLFDSAAELSNQTWWLRHQLNEDSELPEPIRQWLKEYIADKECDNTIGDEIKEFLK